LGVQIMGWLISAIVWVVETYWFEILVVAYSVYGSEQAKRQLSEQQAAARAAYNSALKDRAATRIASEAPHVYVYGRARVGSSIVAILTHGARDEFKHLVCVHAAHECDAIEEVYINGKSLGVLDVDGYVTTGDFFSDSTISTSEAFTGTSFTLAHTPITNSLRVWYYRTVSTSDGSEQRETEVPYTLVGNSVTVTTSHSYHADYMYSSGTPMVRVRKHLGAAGQTADTLTMAEVPTKWATSSTLTGMCYTIVRLNLNHKEFQGGVPSIEVILRGKKLHDVRDGVYPSDTPVWSQNNALMIADYLTSEMCGVPVGDLPLADYIAAANVCDEEQLTGCTYTQSGTTVVVTKASHLKTVSSWVDVNISTGLGLSGNWLITAADANTFTYTSTTSVTTSGNCTVAGKYTANGTVTADQSQPQVLEKMAQSMGGTIVSTTWGLSAGKYVAPVLALTQDDIVGEMSYMAGTPEADLYNGVKGQFISSANKYVVTDYQPFQNSTYVTADGQELWQNVDYIFTDTKQRIWNLNRIFTEDQRNGFTLKAAFSYKAWDLSVGDRVTFTSALLGQTAKIYRVVDKSFSADSAVNITLKEDASTIWDYADSVTVDSTPNTDLPSPFFVPAPSNIQMTEELYETTGSAGVKAKAILTWDAPADINVLDYEVEYKPYFTATFTEIPNVVGEVYELFDLAPGRYDFKVKARNYLGITSAYSQVKTFEVVGLTAAPADVTGFTITPFNGSALARWTRTQDLDVKIGGDIIIRWSPLTAGATWENSVTIPDGELNGDAYSATVALATGTYLAKFLDSTGHYSDTAASFVATEALVTGWSTVSTSTQHTSFTGAKTGVAYDAGTIKLVGTTTIDEMLDNIDLWGNIDSLGGIGFTGTYEFDATVDLSTVASRRFHSHIKALSYNINDLFDSDTLFDGPDLFDGGTINGCSAMTYAAVSDDNITYSGWSPFMVGDFSCRYAKFKTVLSNDATDTNIKVSELSVSIKVPA
jgi:hypothetical protein